MAHGAPLEGKESVLAGPGSPTTKARVHGAAKGSEQHSSWVVVLDVPKLF